MPPLNYHALHYFLMVASEGTFTAAAERLGLSQPALSQQIAQLERSLGRPLFHRGGRRLLLTQLGEYMKGRLETHFHEIELAWAETRFESNQFQSLSIAAVHTLFSYFLPETLVEYRLRNPGARLDVKGRSTLDVLNLVRVRNVDFGLIYGSAAVDQDLHWENLFLEEIVAVYQPGTDVAEQLKATRTLTKAQQVIAFQKGYALRSLIDRATQSRPLDIAMEVDNVSLMLTMTGVGDLVALLPRGLAEARAAEHALEWVSLDWPRITRQVVLVRRSDQRLAAPARALWDEFLQSAHRFIS